MFYAWVQALNYSNLESPDKRFDKQYVPKHTYLDIFFICQNKIQMDHLTHWGRDKIATISADGIFKCIFLKETVWILIRISLKFVPRGPINKIPALVQSSDNSLAPARRQAIIWTNDGLFIDAYIRHSASMS